MESGECNYGVVPVENSTEGMVSHTLDSFMDSSLKISGEVEMRIGHHLLASAATAGGEIHLICAHQQALAQCRNWLDRHWPNVEREAVSSNGEAARRAASEPGVAAEKWAYVFFIEFEGHLQDEKIAGIITELEEQSIMLKPLGSYPRAVI